MNNSFDAYETIGIVLPGAIVGLLINYEFPEFSDLLGNDGVTVGGFGLFLIVAYGLGHAVQALGSLLEKVIWFRSGMPTYWINKDGQSLLTDGQRDQLCKAVQAIEKNDRSLSSYSQIEWALICKRIYARVSAQNKSIRIDAFNRTYGVLRGLAAAILLVFLWAITFYFDNPKMIIFLLIIFFAIAYRMYRYSINYARELFIQFIDNNDASENQR